jgi:hypothetical protein
VIRWLYSRRLVAIASLRRYFRSGWAFLIPYLAAYLLYYWLKWPVNPPSADHPFPPTGLQPPCLLHVFWGLHAINVILATVALVFWWQEERQGTEGRSRESGVRSQKSDDGSQISDFGSPDPESAVPTEPTLVPLATRFPAFPLSRFLGFRLAPWFLLALIFWIPGVYLEFPADPWEHYARTNEWSWLRTVSTHTYSAKSSYFLAYSLLGRVAPPTRQLFWLDFYYAGSCLLLCWQYYRLSRAVGLNDRTSMLFVLLQAFLFGNNIFGFYRYYGIASTVFSQLGTVALVCLAIETAKGIRPGVGRRGEGLAASGFRLSALRLPLPVLRLLGEGGCLLLLIAFNHIQGLAIAGLGLAAVTVWRLIAWRRTMVWWLATAAVTFSVATVLWWPRNPALDSFYRPAGWLTPWYGFNVFSLHAVAGDRTRWIIGLFGLLNLIAGLALLRRNHVIGWLTITPLLALCLPVVAIPFANALAPYYRFGEGIITFPRVLLAIPAGLALVALGERWWECGSSNHQASDTERPDERPISGRNVATPSAHEGIAGEQTPMFHLRPALSSFGGGRSAAFRFPPPGFLLCLLSLAALLLLPVNSPFYNRFWNALVVSPEDLNMHRVIETSGKLPINDAAGPEAADGDYFPPLVRASGLLATPGIGYALQSTGKAWISDALKRVTMPPAAMTGSVLENLRHVDPRRVHPLPFWPIDALYTPCSLAGFLSEHWLPDEVALAHSTQEVLFRPSTLARLERRPPELWLDWSKNLDETHELSRMAPKEALAAPRIGAPLILRPVLRTMDGNGWRVSVYVTGPDSFHRFFEDRRRPLPLGGESRIFSDFEIRLPRSGEYTIEVNGDVAWPAQTCTARYRLLVGQNTAPQERPSTP